MENKDYICDKKDMCIETIINAKIKRIKFILYYGTASILPFIYILFMHKRILFFTYSISKIIILTSMLSVPFIVFWYLLVLFSFDIHEKMVIKRSLKNKDIKIDFPEINTGDNRYKYGSISCFIVSSLILLICYLFNASFYYTVFFVYTYPLLRLLLVPIEYMLIKKM